MENAPSPQMYKCLEMRLVLRQMRVISGASLTPADQHRTPRCVTATCAPPSPRQRRHWTTTACFITGAKHCTNTHDRSGNIHFILEIIIIIVIIPSMCQGITDHVYWNNAIAFTLWEKVWLLAKKCFIIILYMKFKYLCFIKTFEWNLNVTNYFVNCVGMIWLFSLFIRSDRNRVFGIQISLFNVISLHLLFIH